MKEKEEKYMGKNKRETDIQYLELENWIALVDYLCARLSKCTLSLIP